MKFNDLSLPSALERALVAMRFQEPTPIQVQAIPVALTGRDVIATAQTGTGKTAAFGIPTASFLLKNPQSVALVLVPTRELAQQIDVFWRNLTKFAPELRSACIIGGASFGVQAKMLSRNARLIIATPGRLVDHLTRRTVNLSKTGVLILDEADRMLDMGFAPQLSRILSFMPQTRQTLFFSATWGNDLDQLAKKCFKNSEKPVRIAVGSVSQAASSVEQTAITTTTQAKNETLLDELKAREGTVLIFARTQVRTDRLARYLSTYGLEVGRLHGGRTQGQRNAALSAFRSGQRPILVATDIAARGIDVSQIAHVINYDLPMVAEDYVHRIGRTGRAGATGTALSLLTPEDRGQWREISLLLKKTGSAMPTLREGRRLSDPSQKPLPQSQPQPQLQQQHQRPRDEQRQSRPHRGGRPHQKQRRHRGERPQYQPRRANHG